MDRSGFVESNYRIRLQSYRSFVNLCFPDQIDSSVVKCNRPENGRSWFQLPYTTDSEFSIIFLVNSCCNKIIASTFSL